MLFIQLSIVYVPGGTGFRRGGGGVQFYKRLDFGGSILKMHRM